MGVIIKRGNKLWRREIRMRLEKQAQEKNTIIERSFYLEKNQEEVGSSIVTIVGICGSGPRDVPINTTVWTMGKAK